MCVNRKSHKASRSAGEISPLHSKPFNERNGLVYIRGCQEHFFPSAGGAGLVRDIQPLTIEDARVVSCPWVFHLSSCIFLSSDDANQFRN